MAPIMKETSFIFEDQSSAFTCCDTVTAECAKVPQGVSRAKREISAQHSDIPSHNVDKEKDNLDQYLASTMKGLSVQERETALEELNGIVDNKLEATMEVPAVLDQKLIEMDQHLQRIKGNSIYETAESMNPQYVQNRKFRIMFLRGKRYDPKEAAEQMLDFFESKLMLFGKEKLCKDITLDDMDEEDRLSIRKGGVQLLQRDVGGRMICSNMRGAVKHKSIINELRTKYYTFMSMVESEETQKKGAIAVLYVVGDYYKDKNGGSGLAKLGNLVKSLPIHWAGFHFCCGDLVQFVMIRALVLTFPKHLAAKFRCHKGHHLECMYGMRTYGIPASCLPIPDTGENKPPLMYQHMIWYQNRERIDREKDGKVQLCPSSAQKQKSTGPVSTAAIIPHDDDDFSLDDNPSMEADNGHQQRGAGLQLDAPSRGDNTGSLPQVVPPGPQTPIHESISLAATAAAANTVITPRRSDVLFGPKYKHHPGTVNLQELAAQQSPIFESISHRADKTEFVGSLVQHLKASGIRFLEMNKGTNSWIEVDDKFARNKVAKIFRNKRRTTGVGPSSMPSFL
ncbi:unnamed protein product [Cylindrotheca closterium]|uniref:DUF6824 domain-containing protein n=1 Tax=Cylindrotheca closterium TaxID=2856 RepID=A0AAD2PX95_9STRA|nr:unnamed protein product [Cylindrotheca closterium]